MRPETKPKQHMRAHILAIEASPMKRVSLAYIRCDTDKPDEPT